MTNQYEPWIALGITELEYFKARYLEARQSGFAEGKEEGIRWAIEKLKSEEFQDWWTDMSFDGDDNETIADWLEKEAEKKK